LKLRVFVGVVAIGILAFAVYAFVLSVSKSKLRNSPLPLGEGQGEGTRSTHLRQATPPALHPEGSGTIAGEVEFAGSPPEATPLKVGADPTCAKSRLYDEQVLVKNGRLQNVVVRISGGLPAEPPPDRPIEVDQEGCVYRPHVQAGVAGQKLVIRNSDPVLHNVHAYAASSSLFNWAQPPQSAPRETVLQATEGIVKLRCDMHPWMTSYVVVANNRFFAVTSEAGTFRIEGVPTGEYELQAWHERLGVRTTRVSVKRDAVSEARFTFSSLP